MFYCTLCAHQRGWPISPSSHGRCELCERVIECTDTPSRLLDLPSEEQLAAIEERRTRISQMMDESRRNCCVTGLSVHEVIATVVHANLDPAQWTINAGDGVEGPGVYLEPVVD